MTEETVLSEIVSEFQAEKNNSSTMSKRIVVEEKYMEAWYELGAPISLPFLKYAFACGLYMVDGFFLIKNAYNAITSEEDTEDKFTHPQIIAASILGLHCFCSILISIVDSLNKDAISGYSGKYINKKHKSMIFFRALAHLTLTMKLFRYTTAYLENRRRNRQLHKLRMRRSNLSDKEIQFVVDQKKNQLVESHYDIVESFFKVVPGALLQVYLMFKTQRHARLSLYSTVDQDRFATVFFTVITASISTANYQFDYLAYKKVLRFQDCFRSGFKHEINLTIPGDSILISNVVHQFCSIGIRMCFYSALIFSDPYQFLITMSIILVVNTGLTFVFNKTAWRFRPVLENPLFGTPWPAYDLIDLWINLFVPGVHYAKPLDYVLNFYTTLIAGVAVFGSWDFLSPAKTSKAPEFFFNDTVASNRSVPLLFPSALQYFNSSRNENIAFISEVEDTINFFVKHIIIIHEYLTFNQISYAGFFYNIVKFMNVVNFFSFCYTCTMNWMSIYDLDFPIQIVNSFYITIFEHFAKAENALPAVDEFNENGTLIRRHSKKQIFLVFSLLTNSKFFLNVPTVKMNNCEQLITKEYLLQLIDMIKNGENLVHSTCYDFLDIVAKFVSPILYPGRFREPTLNWELETDRSSIISYLAGHPLREQMIVFLDLLYDQATQDEKLLLAVFYANYNEIVRNYTSLRIKRTFEFLHIPVEKGEADLKLRTASGHHIRNDYELGYWQRLVREARGKAELFI